LYLPPRIPHEGVALDDDCVTVSVGFRRVERKLLVLVLVN
jgi:50S ribosomal protein L16 3-hydroxylase